MKKVILLALCLALGSLALAGCARDGEPFEAKSYTPDTPVNEIRLDVRDREIEVSLSGDGQIHIQYYENSRESYDLSVSDEKVLTMTGKSNKEWTDYIGVKTAAQNRKITLQLPDGLLENLTLSTTNEDITLPALTVTGSVRLLANNGDIAFGRLGVGKALCLTVKNGDISGTVLGSYGDFAIHSKVKKGESNLPGDREGGEKTLEVSCNNGDVHIDFAG